MSNMAKKKALTVKSPVDEMLGKIREIIGQYADNIGEKECYEALMTESEGWDMRLTELNDDPEENEDD